jgi:hypothetical protein
MNWQRWNWLNDVWLPLLLATLRACWLWPWLDLARRGLSPSLTEDLLPIPLIIAVALGGMAAARWALAGVDDGPLRTRLIMTARHEHLRRARLKVVSLGLVAILAVLWYQFYRAYPVWDVGWVKSLGQALTHWGDEVPPPFIVLLAAAYLWLRGVLDGRAPLEHDEIWGAFAAGFLWLALALAAAALGGSQTLASVSRLIFPFFAVGMAALALSSIKLVNKSVKESGARLGFNRYWGASVVSVTVGLLGLGLALSVLITPETVARSLGWVTVILTTLGEVLVLVFMAISYVVFLVLEPLIKWLQTMIQPGAPFVQIHMPDIQGQLREMSKNTTPASLTIGEWPRWVGLAGLILVIGVVFAVALRRFWTEAGEGIDETRETILSRDLLQAQLSALWRAWWDRFRRAPEPAPDPFLSLEGETDARRAIRAIYQALLGAARDRGLTRTRSQTPLEYQHTLEEALPDAQDALDAITDGYQRARYAPQPPHAEQVEWVRQAWDRLRTAFEAQDEGEANGTGGDV